MQSSVMAHGHLHVFTRDERGEVKHDFEVDNLVVDLGLAFIASRMVATSANVMSHMALGSGAAAPAHGDTTLGTELGRAALASSTSNANVVTYQATFNPGVATGNVTEAGITNAASGGTLLNRATFGLITKAAGDTTTITWTITLS